MGIFDLFLTQCPVPIGEFRARCRVPIVKGRVNRWVLLAGVPTEAPDADDLRDTAAELVSEQLQGAVEDVRVRVFEQGADIGKVIEGEKLAARADCPFPMSTVGPAFQAVIAEFRATDAAPADIPWVAVQQTGVIPRDSQFQPSDCPVAAEWILDRAFVATEAHTLSEEERPKPGVLDRAKEAIGDAAKTALTGYLVIGGIAALVALAWMRK